MDQPLDLGDPRQVTSEMIAEIQALPVRSTPNERTVLRKYARQLGQSSPEYVLDVARVLFREHGSRWLACEVLASHKAAFARIGEAELEEFGQGMNSWGSVDGFARLLSGPAWLKGQVSDGLIHRWARFRDLWWRRAALVSTVALNVRSHGGMGDVPRTLEVCRMLVDDDEDMVVKAMSWALRELVVHDPDAVRTFLQEHEDVLAPRVKREVGNKLTTGLKNPRRKRSHGPRRT